LVIAGACHRGNRLTSLDATVWRNTASDHDSSFGTAVAKTVPRVTSTRPSAGDDDMVQRVFKATVSGWRPWAIGAALSMVGAALLVFRKYRMTEPIDPDEIYEAWWKHREKVRANGDHPPASSSGREGNSQLFV
jgi:hypothetical protein